MNYRKQRGIHITKRKHQIYRMDDTTYGVKSQTEPGVQYTLKRTTAGWDCSCPDNTQYCKHAYALEERLGMKARSDRGIMIHQNGNQVECITSDHYLVKSQSKDESYEVRDFGSGWMCSCPDHIHTGSTCKHIQAVQWCTGEQCVIQESNQIVCTICNSSNVIRKGMQAGHYRYRCKSCGKHFTDNLGFEGRHSTPEHITIAVELVYAGLSIRKTSRALRTIHCVVGRSTVHRWADEYGHMMEAYLDEITPLVGEEWRTDEIYLKIRGERKYLFAMLDSKTRYWIARQVSAHKGTDDVRPMFRKAKEVADKIPSKLISDGAANFGEAHDAEYTPRNFTWKDSIHEAHIRLDGDINNNQMESFNGNTIRLREKVVRGLKKEDAAILAGLKVYHNHIRPHLGLSEGETPGEAAGVHVNGENKILTIIRAAAKARRE